METTVDITIFIAIVSCQCEPFTDGMRSVAFVNTVEIGRRAGRLKKTDTGGAAALFRGRVTTERGLRAIERNTGRTAFVVRGDRVIASRLREDARDCLSCRPYRGPLKEVLQKAGSVHEPHDREHLLCEAPEGAS